MSDGAVKPSEVPVVYDPATAIGFFGLEKLHSFDVGKYARIADELVAAGWVAPDGFLGSEPLDDAALSAVHDAGYLASLHDRHTLSAALELPIPPLMGFLVERRILAPLRRAVAGTRVAARAAVARGGLVVHLGGGFHHARPAFGHGFCPYNDVAWALHGLRGDGFDAPVLIVDTDAHQGDGNHAFFADDPSVFSYSIHQSDAFPIPKVPGDLDDPIPAYTPAAEHLELIARRMPELLERVRPGLVLHVAGADVLHDDPLTLLSMHVDDLVERDRIVADAAREAGVPLVYLMAGGYGPSAALAQRRSIEAMLAAEATRPVVK